MRESNKVKKCTFSSNVLLLVATVLSILMILTSSSSSPVPPSIYPLAFASHGGDYGSNLSMSDIATSNYNHDQKGEDDSGLIDNLISQQQNPQAYNQEAYKKVGGEEEEKGEGEDEGEDDSGLIDNLISQQQSPQAYARNINADNKVIIVENCEDGEVIINDNDQIIQTNAQSFNQEAYNQVGGEEEEKGEGEDEGEDDSGLIDNLISQQQSPQAYARNINADNKVIIVEKCEDGEVIINDNDQIIQTNAQSFNQEAYNQVGGEDEGEDDSGLIDN